jgi:hypothetical protein
MKKPWQSSFIPIPDQISGEPVPIISDGALATVIVGEGRLIPVLILDTSKRSDIEDLVKAHALLPPGDVKSRWGYLNQSKNNIALILSFERPSNILVIIEFNIVDQGVLIEQILNANALYIQPGKKGDRPSDTFNNPRILVEIPDTIGFIKEWKNIWLKELAKKYGLKPQKARVILEKFISDIQAISKFRIPQI